MQTAFNNGVGYFPPGDYVINPETGLLPPSGLYAYGPGRVVFAASDASSYPGVHLNAVSNVRWQVDIVSDAASHVGDGSPGCHALRITGGADHTIGCAISDSPGDGVYIHSDSQRPILSGMHLTTCGRQGIAIVDADDWRVEDVTVVGLVNEAVHIEPNAGENVHGGVVRRVTAQGCARAVTATTQAAGSSIDTLTIEDCTATACTSSAESTGAFEFRGVDVLTLTRNIAQDGVSQGFKFEDMGDVTAEDCHALNNTRYGYYVDENLGHSASYTLTRCHASGNGQGGALFSVAVPVLIDCEGIP